MSDTIEARHRKEQKDLQSTITSLKKQATKKTRKNVNNKCLDLQRDLDEKHKKELNELNGVSTQDDFSPEKLLAQLELEKTEQPEQPEQPEKTEQAKEAKPKRNRAKEKLAKRKAEIEAIQAQARLELENSIDYKKIEQDSMNQILSLQNLKVFDIRPDGHCLFASIKDQLHERHQLDVSIDQLRLDAAKYMESHKDDFEPFLFDPDTMQQHNLTEYLQELTTTAMWGSDLEIKALAHVFDCPIKVFVAGASPIHFNSEASLPELKLGFYKYSYGLGEHYNSLRDI